VLHTGAKELTERLARALLGLPAEQREVFLLRQRGGLELAAIARVTGANLSTVKSRLRYALAGLRRALGDELLHPAEIRHD
jgi:RNA polymerase sigma-70 factor (ECF subfamily)